MGRRFAVVFVLLYCTAVYTSYILRTITYDEAFTFVHYAQDPISALFKYTLPNNHLLHSFLVWISTSVFGDSLIGLRFPAYAAGLLALAATYRLGARLWGHRAGIIALVLLAMLIPFANYSTIGRGYTLCALLTILLFEQVYFSPPTPGRRYRYQLLLLTWMLIMTLPSMLFFVAALVLWLAFWATPSRDQQLVQTVLALVAGSIMGLLFYASVFIGNIFSHSLETFGYLSVRQLMTDWVRFAFETPVSGALLALGIFAALWHMRKSRVANLFLLVFVVAILLTIIQGLVVNKLFYPRNYFYLTPLLALVSGYGVAGTLKRAALPVAIVLLLCAPFILQTLSEHTGTDSLLLAIDNHRQDQDTLVVGCCLDAQIQYMFHADPVVFTASPDTNRLVFVPTRHFSFDELADAYQAKDIIRQCDPAIWDDVEVMICTVKQADTT